MAKMQNESNFRSPLAAFCWKAGVYLSPSAFGLVVWKWGDSLPAWAIIVFAAISFGLVPLAGLLALKDRGFRKTFNEFPLIFVSVIAIGFVEVVGTVSYLLMRPAHTPAVASPLPPPIIPVKVTATEPPRNPPQRTTHETKQRKNIRENTQGGTGNQQQNVGSVNCEGSSNCAGINNGVQLNQFGVAKPLPTLDVTRTVMMSKETQIQQMMRESTDPRMPIQPYVPYPEIIVTVSLHGDFVSPAFSVLCDRPCFVDPIKIDPFPAEGRYAIDDYKSTDPNEYILTFPFPHAFSSGTHITLQVGAKDRQSFKILKVRPYMLP